MSSRFSQLFMNFEKHMNSYVINNAKHVKITTTIGAICGACHFFGYNMAIESNKEIDEKIKKLTEENIYEKNNDLKSKGNFTINGITMFEWNDNGNNIQNEQEKSKLLKELEDSKCNIYSPIIIDEFDQTINFFISCSTFACIGYAYGRFAPITVPLSIITASIYKYMKKGK